MEWGDGLIANFYSGADQPWQPAQPVGGAWHKDGAHYRNFLDSPEHGLSMLVFWSDVLPRGGGTFIACDSVPVVARYLLDHPEGISVYELSSEHNPHLIAQCNDLMELTGRAGDVVLLHPFLLHSISRNHAGHARFINNPVVRLKEPMNFNRREMREYSLVERAILQGLGVERLDFQPARERRVFTSEESALHKKAGAEMPP